MPASLPFTDLRVSTAFHEAIGFKADARYTDGSAVRRVQGDAISFMLLTHAR